MVDQKKAKMMTLFPVLGSRSVFYIIVSPRWYCASSLGLSIYLSHFRDPNIGELETNSHVCELKKSNWSNKIEKKYCILNRQISQYQRCGKWARFVVNVLQCVSSTASHFPCYGTVWSDVVWYGMATMACALWRPISLHLSPMEPHFPQSLPILPLPAC